MCAPRARAGQSTRRAALERRARERGQALQLLAHRWRRAAYRQRARRRARAALAGLPPGRNGISASDRVSWFVFRVSCSCARGSGFRRAGGFCFCLLCFVAVCVCVSHRRPTGRRRFLCGRAARRRRERRVPRHATRVQPRRTRHSRLAPCPAEGWRRRTSVRPFRRGGAGRAARERARAGVHTQNTDLAPSCGDRPPPVVGSIDRLADRSPTRSVSGDGAAPCNTSRTLPSALPAFSGDGAARLPQDAAARLVPRDGAAHDRAHVDAAVPARGVHRAPPGGRWARWGRWALGVLVAGRWGRWGRYALGALGASLALRVLGAGGEARDEGEGEGEGPPRQESSRGGLSTSSGAGGGRAVRARCRRVRSRRGGVSPPAQALGCAAARRLVGAFCDSAPSPPVLP